MKKLSPSKLNPSSKPFSTFTWIFALSIALFTLLFYLPVLNNQFVNWDDAEAIIDNPYIRFLNFSSFQWIFTTFHTGNWIPLTWLSFALDYAIAGLNPKIYHFHNLLLHVVNTLLVFFLSLKILKLAMNSDKKIQHDLTIEPGEISKGWVGKITPQLETASLTALLFGLHPIHVESVAWATERKDLLCALFFFASLLVYVDVVTSVQKNIGKRLLCLGLFALALLAKPMALTLPLIFLLLDVWPLKRFSSHFPKVLGEKIPFFLLSLAITIITIMAQAHAGAISTTTEIPFDLRLMNAFHSLFFYIEKMVIPFDLVPFYPLVQKGYDIFSFVNLFALLFVIVISSLCYVYRKTRPYLGVAWLYYVITLVPVLGILQVGSQAAADRYTYIPSVSLLLLFSTSFFVIFHHYRAIVATFSFILLTALGFATMHQISIWNNSVTLWESVIRIYPHTSMIAHTNLANAYKQVGRLNEALREYDRALAFRQPHAYIYDGKGMVLLDKGLVEEAIQQFKQASALDSRYASPHRNLWFAYEKKGWYDLALTEILLAIKIKPDFTEAYNNLGISYGRQSKFNESIEAFKQAIERDPYNSMFLINLATTYQRIGEWDQAIELYKQSLKLNANESICYLNLANTYLSKGLLTEAILTLQDATHLQPPNADIFQKLALAYEKAGQKELALEAYTKSLHIKETRPIQ